MGKRHKPEDIEWWRNKIVERVDGKAFNRNVGEYAVLILERLAQKPGGQVSGNSLKQIANQLDVPSKYLARSIGLLSRYSLIVLEHQNTFTAKINKGQIKRSRAKLSFPERKHFFELERNRCGHCLRKFPDKELRIDHIVPLSMLGADAPGNWGALCAKCNRLKLHDFDKEWLRYYRDEPVKQTVGVSFQNGAFWPKINSKIRKSTSLI